MEKTLSPETQAAGIAARLRQDIVTGRLEFGTKLTLARLEALYGVGQMPVRDALRHLQADGLIELSPNRVARVRQVDFDFVLNLFDIRVAIEAMLTRRAAERIRGSDLDRLAAAADAYENAGAQDVQVVLDANRAFHSIIYEVAGNAEAAEILRRHEQLVTALWHRHGHSLAQKSASNAEHRQIIVALSSHDVDSAAGFAMAHAARAKLELMRKMRATARALGKPAVI
jgi:DNA-binding GntR family transcriptional regulator